MSSQHNRFPDDGYYNFSTAVQTVTGNPDAATNSITTFYWTSFRQTFSGYWGDDYDTSEAVVVEQTTVDQGNLGCMLSPIIALLLLSFALL